MEDLIDQFDALSESGDKYTVCLWQEYTVFTPLSGPQQKLPTMKRYATSMGAHLNQIDAETFKIVQTDEIIRKIR